MAEEQAPIIIKRIKKAAHGHHGGAWKVAYADFVTAMMAFFLVMWIVGMSQEDKEGIQKYFNDPISFLMGSMKINTGVFQSTAGNQNINASEKGGVMESAKAGGITRLHLLAQEIDKGMTPFKSEVFDFKVFPDRIQFAITAQSLFAPGSILIRPEAEPLLNRIANVLKKTDAYIMIEAHTDDLPSESYAHETNWELSTARAAKVVRYFVDGHYFDPAKMTAMGAAEFQPIADNATPEGRSKNRRIDLYIIPANKSRFGFRGTASEPDDH
jgi:chemotaxis protein MotB